jgi:hypothetical protein
MSKISPADNPKEMGLILKEAKTLTKSQAGEPGD